MVAAHVRPDDPQVSLIDDPYLEGSLGQFFGREGIGHHDLDVNLARTFVGQKRFTSF
jgi:hypothetical protein